MAEDKSRMTSWGDLTKMTPAQLEQKLSEATSGLEGGWLTPTDVARLNAEITDRQRTAPDAVTSRILQQTQLLNDLSANEENPLHFGTVQPVATPTDASKAQALQRPTPQATPVPVKDFRVRLSAQEGQAERVYGPWDRNNLMYLLWETMGMMFPYTPTIQYQQNVDYKALDMVHTNQDFHAYSRTPSLELTIAGDFTIQNQREGEYALACIHFLRSSSKMYFGKPASAEVTLGGVTFQTNPVGTLAGTPPPVLVLNGYGNYMFNNVKVLLKNHSYTLDKNVDYFSVKTVGGFARLPVHFQISVGLVVHQTPDKMRREFDLAAFRRGDLMRNGKFGWL